jgi:hypothetical protein
MKMFQVIPNPFQLLDAEGTPISVFPCHAKHSPGQFVGATKKLVVSKEAKFVNVKGKSGIRREVAQLDRSKAAFTIELNPVGVPADGEVGSYYRRGIRAGSLIPADKATADACGLPFIEPKEAIESARKAAAKEFELQFGKMPEWATSEKPAPQPAPK